jgi:hypothetical protein
VLLILTVFVFHSIRAFDTEDWQIKNATTYFGAQVIEIFLSTWMMPTIFVVSGAAVFYALGKRGTGRFIHERALRLLVPLVVALFTHAAVQAYLERVNHGQNSGSFWQWYPGYVHSVGAHFGRAWQGYHLWYLEMLFVFSLVCLPLFLWLRHGGGARLLSWLGERLSVSGAIYLPMVLAMVTAALLDPRSGFLANYMSTGGWNTPSYLVFFLAGFLIGSSHGLQERIRRLRRTSLACGMAATVVAFGLYAAAGKLDPGTTAFRLVFATRSMAAWCLVLAVLGFGLQRLTSRTPFLDYANEAVMPFYVLHQSVLIVIGFFVVGWAIPDLLKWSILAVVSFSVIVASYEFLVRRNNVMRVLFGMKSLPKAPRPALSPEHSPSTLG